ncbi:MAG: hypothetical protein JRH19_17720 [Deltaproteobacteria bacterium]|nr:hypothetical protein [Deltaproteobacteria bacterium]
MNKRVEDGVRGAEHRRPFTIMSRGLASLAVMLLLASSMEARAEAPPSAAVQLAFLDPIQTIEQERSIRGMRLCLLRGANQGLTGVDVSAVATVTQGSMRGLQIAVANQVSGGVTGLQLGAFMNEVGGDLRGVQLSAVTSQVSGGTGVQIATVYADVKQLKGLQVGIVTHAEELHGLQLGLLNFNKNGFLPVFPIFNFGR